jgi:diguanylate cyclase (GGDEF)-like protein
VKTIAASLAPASEVDRLRREVAALRAAIELLHRIGNLVGGELELEPTCYAVLTAVTAGVGLGFNRAMLFLMEGDASSRVLPTMGASPPRSRPQLRGACAVGPVDHEEADRVWRSIEADAHDLETLYESGLRHHRHPGKLDQRVRHTIVDPDGDTPVSLALRRGATVIGEGEDDLDGLFHPPTSIAAPLRYAQGMTGVLYADNTFNGRLVDPVAEQVFSMVADHAGRAIGNARRFEEVAGAARTDALTGLRHHGAFMTDLFREASAAKARKRHLGLAMIDLDGFKQVNDRYGHLAGDALLAGLASRMRGVVRGGEGIYRYGGDEFAALLPGADRAAAALVGGRLHAAVSGQPFALNHERTVSVTCSVGIASMPEDAADATGLVEAADRAMFRAKASGKDQVG